MKKIGLKLSTILLLSLAICQGSFSQSSNIRLNQIGFYPNCSKIGIVSGSTAGTTFFIKSTNLATTYYTGTLGASNNWTFSSENVCAADFSSFTTAGTYVLNIPAIGSSYPFKIDPYVHVPVSKASVKAYYFQRSSTAITAANGGVYQRSAGHPDNSVIVLPSAASAARPAGTSLSMPKGWYDAGDYNSYIVNSGISTYTLMASYEHFKSYFDTLNLNIPESGDAVPDILDEIKWNLDWMLTMQDPNDGGVYNKKTNANFDGFIMPSAATTTRYVCAKGTAATFDFAAVMAVAYRIYKPFNLTFANQCLAAAQSAWTWGVANPNIAFNNPGASVPYPAVVTGGYGDGTFTDEKEWAANELYIATLNGATYYPSGFKNANFYGIPSWPNVSTLGLISLVFNRTKLNATAFPDTTNMKTKLIAIGTGLRDHQSTVSAYKVAMGQGGNGDFNWGSNSQAANQGILLMSSYEVNKDATYFTAALSNLDYLLGRNAVNYSFVTGYGGKTPMDPHQRISNADGIVNPLPGWIVGGPQNSNNPDGCAYVGTQPATKYLDNVCSYSTNEIAINWNAPFVFLSAAAQALNPCTGISLPVELLSFEALKEKDQVALSWSTANEINNDYFNIERSSDGNNFIIIGKVEAGKSNAFNAYNFTDANPVQGTAYYRLAQHDTDGRTKLSSIISVNIEAGGIKIYPNPSEGNFTVELNSYHEVSLTILNILGEKIYSEKIKEGENIFMLRLPEISKGIYLLSIIQGDKVKIRKIIVE